MVFTDLMQNYILFGNINLIETFILFFFNSFAIITANELVINYETACFKQKTKVMLERIFTNRFQIPGACTEIVRPNIGYIYESPTYPVYA